MWLLPYARAGFDCRCTSIISKRRSTVLLSSSGALERSTAGAART
jgi:hypothetical protein